MNDGRSFESYVQFVFSSLLNMKDEGVVVGRDVQLVDKLGLAHRVDIFYQFERAGITHKVAIECKDHGRPVENGEVAKFYGKLRDAGALRQRLNSVALPDATAIGEPFWTIMEVEDGRVTGSYFVHESPSGKNILLFYCKLHAEQIASQMKLDSQRWAVRGLPRHALRAFLLLVDMFRERSGIQPAILFKPPGFGADESFLCAPAGCGALMAEYYGGDIELMRARLPPR